MKDVGSQASHATEGSGQQEHQSLLNQSNTDGSNAPGTGEPSASTGGDANEEINKFRHPIRWLLVELQCVLETDEKEQDPFGKRRLTFIFAVAVLSIVLNIVVIPLVLTRMDHNRNYTEAPTLAPTASPAAASPTKTSIPVFPTTTFSPSLQDNTVTLEPTTSIIPPPPSVTSTTNSPISSNTNPPTPMTPIDPSPTVNTDTDANVPSPLTPAPTNEAVIIALPPYTLPALNDPQSPQSKAFKWLTADPNLATYNSARSMQRMALATFFFATNLEFRKQAQDEEEEVVKPMADGGDPEVFFNLFNGDAQQPKTLAWNKATNWLAYDIHECFWFSEAPFVCDSGENYRYLTLPNNNLVGSLPPELGLLTLLQHLNLSRNPGLYGSIPDNVGLLTQLQELKLSNLPQLSGSIPDSIPNNLHIYLRTIELRETPYFQKILSTHLGKLTRLQGLLLDTRINQGKGATTLRGILPTELGLMRSLQNFTISGEEVVGTLPSELGEVSSLEWLQVADTQITGTIPRTLGQLTRLTRLELLENNLVGRLPQELSYLRSLTRLSLQNNALTGTIPYQYSNLTRCLTMSLQNNELSGTVPLGLCYLRDIDMIQTLQVDCSREDEKVECVCDCECY